AARMAIDYPQSVSRLVLYGTPIPAGFRRNLQYIMTRVPFQAVLPIAPLVLPGSGTVLRHLPFVRQLTTVLLRQWRVPLQPERLDAEFLDYSTDHSRVGLEYSLRDIFLMHDLYSDLPQITQPTCMIIGDSDVLVQPEALTSLVDTYPRMSMHIIANAGHVALLDQPDSFIQIVNDFLCET